MTAHIINNLKCMCPVKNVTWVLVKIPCHILSQIDGSLVQFHTKFHVIYPRFLCFPCYNMTSNLQLRRMSKLTFTWSKILCDFYIIFPVKNMTGILMEIPCHFSSQLDLVVVRSKSTANSMTILCHLSRFYLLSMMEHDMDFG